jgi:hypothetical protein
VVPPADLDLERFDSADCSRRQLVSNRHCWCWVRRQAMVAEWLDRVPAARHSPSEAVAALVDLAAPERRLEKRARRSG